MLNIITNNKPRELLCASDLTVSELDEFDYIDEPDELGLNFFRYMGQVYSLDNFMYIKEDSADFSGWHGAQSMTAFSGVLMRYVDDNERVVIARY